MVLSPSAFGIQVQDDTAPPANLDSTQRDHPASAHSEVPQLAAQTIFGQRVDLVDLGWHKMLHIRKKEDAQSTLLRVDAMASVEGECTPETEPRTSIQELRLTGTWAEAMKKGGLQIRAKGKEMGGVEMRTTSGWDESDWMSFGKGNGQGGVDMKVMRVHNEQKARSLEFFINLTTEDLSATNHVGGLLAAETPPRRSASRTCGWEAKAKQCGLRTDCPLDYKISDVEKAAALSRTGRDSNEQVRKDLLEKALHTCHCTASVLSSGDWCYPKKGERTALKSVHHIDHDYELPRFQPRVFSDTFAQNIVKHILNNGSHSVTELGAGVGQAGHSLKYYLPKLQYHGYDGAGNVEEYTKGYVQFADLSRPMSLKVSDWVFTSQVGEHIPHRYESQFIANAHAHNCKGVILTWANLGQPGQSHVNNHKAEYLVKVFTQLGYNLDKDKTEAVRDGDMSVWPWNKKALIFTRKETPAFCKP